MSNKNSLDNDKPIGQSQPLRRPFPLHTLEESLVIPRTLKDYNGGNPWTGLEIARALGRSGKTPDFFYLTASSRGYALTQGTNSAKSISLADIGRDYLFAENPAAEKDALKRAFFSVRIFKEVFDYYQGSKLPDVKYLQNNLDRKFGLAPKYHADFYRIFQANCSFIESIVTGQMLSATRIPSLSSAEGRATDSSERAFAIMPFSEKTQVYPAGFYNEVLGNLIIPAGVASGFDIYTARKEGSDLIHATIIKELIDAPLVICDLTEHNPNVLFELGFRIAQGKPVVLIRAKGTAPVFDVDNLLRVWEYDPNLWKSTLEDDVPALSKHLTGAWENRNSPLTYLRILTGRGAEASAISDRVIRAN